MNNNYKMGVSKDFPLQTPYTEFHSLTKQIFDLEKPDYMQRVKQVSFRGHVEFRVLRRRGILG